ncbi:MAG: glycine zipper 2TM domain-containing protein [Campylobacterales bacterium]|nr:glycine zipper 2TM domain-containing protein [Campylobacterales bacterium]
MKIKNIIIASMLFFGVNSFSKSLDERVVFVDVIKSKPVYEEITVKVPYEEIISTPYEVTVPCIQKEHHHEREYRKDDNSIGLDTVIGAGLGVVLGNQIGKGDGRTVAKVAGGVLGAVVANKYYRDEQYEGRYDNRTRYCKKKEYRDEIVTRYEYKKERRFIGYENIFIYKGERYSKITDKPRRKIKITNTLSF